MISVFRKLRRIMLEKSAIKKYVLYAFGEILLVIMGILMALQVNNWNEQRKLNNREIIVLKNLLEELQQDSLSLNSFIILTGGKENDGKKIRNMIEGKLAVDSVFLVFRSFVNGKVIIHNTYLPTFEELIASGNLSILKNQKLVDRIKRHMKSQSDQQSFFYNEAQKRKEMYNTHLYQYFPYEIMAWLWENAQNRTWENLSAFKSDINGYLNDPETLKQVNIQIGVDAEMRWYYEQRVMNRLKEIIDMVRIEIKEKS